MNMYEPKLKRLNQYYKLACGHRDSLSIFVERVAENVIRVHRQFYIYNEFYNFYINNQYENRLDFRDAVNDISLDEFFDLLDKFIDRNINSKNHLVANELREIKIRYIENDFHSNDIETNHIEEFIDDINDVFVRYYFSLTSNSFASDETIYNKVNENIDKCINYNSEIHYEDYEEKPNIHPATGEEHLYELRVYNVGQANCSALIKYKDDTKTDYKVIMVYDLGYQKSNGKNSQLEKMIEKIDGDTTILISHFHSDHINNIVNHLLILTTRWLFPKYEGKNKKGLKTFQTLIKIATIKTFSGTLYNFPVPYSFSENISIHQYLKAIKGDRNQTSLTNSHCLVCKVSIGAKDVLIPGDALYGEYGDGLLLDNNKKYDYILVPHHGCKYDGNTAANRKMRIAKFIGNDTIGIVMCGKNNYGHANENHLSWFQPNNVHLFSGSVIYDDAKNHIRTCNNIKVDYYKIEFN